MSWNKEEYAPILDEEMIPEDRNPSRKKLFILFATALGIGVAFCVAVVVPLQNRHLKTQNNGPDSDFIVAEVVGDEVLENPKQCPIPPKSQNFDVDLFQGIWYEIARIQTPGGAVFQEGCRCTTLNFATTSAAVDGLANGTITMSCHDDRLNGRLVNVKAEMIAKNEPGSWTEMLYFQKINWDLIAQNIDYAMSYDCTVEEDGDRLEYCVHILCRSPVYDPNVLTALLELIPQSILNPYNRTMETIDQTSGICIEPL